jgi:hypothetical protein
VFRDGAHANLLVGARYGAVGAYAATLLFIGERAIRRELTNGAAVWAVILLALGPMLAAAVAAVYLESSRPTNDVSPWSHAVVYIVAGMSPKWIVGVLTEAAHRLLADRSSPSGNRLVPLTQLRGVTDEIASRLGEESILDSRLMAMADPVILFRNTNYPRRAILDWIDEAMLITTLPESWQAIERAGITGAIDLAWLWLGTQFEAMRGRNPDLPPPGAPTPGGLTATQQLAALANEARIDVGLLSGVAQRFAEDAQVQLIWYLYRYEDEVPIEVLAQRAQPAP